MEGRSRRVAGWPATGSVGQCDIEGDSPVPGAAWSDSPVPGAAWRGAAVASRLASIGQCGSMRHGADSPVPGATRTRSGATEGAVLCSAIQRWRPGKHRWSPMGGDGGGVSRGAMSGDKQACGMEATWRRHTTATALASAGQRALTGNSACQHRAAWLRTARCRAPPSYGHGDPPQRYGMRRRSPPTAALPPCPRHGR